MPAIHACPRHVHSGFTAQQHSPQLHVVVDVIGRTKVHEGILWWLKSGNGLQMPLLIEVRFELEKQPSSDESVCVCVILMVCVCVVVCVCV